MRKLKKLFATHLVQHTSVAEFPVKGSGLTPLDFPKYGLRCYMKLLWLSISEAHTQASQAYNDNKQNEIMQGTTNASNKNDMYDNKNDAMHNTNKERERELRDNGSNAKAMICFEVRAPSSTSPPSPS